MKDTDHFLADVPFTSVVNGNIEEQRGCALRDIQFWARAKHSDGLERPHCWGLSAAQQFVGSLPPVTQEA